MVPGHQHQFQTCNVLIEALGVVAERYGRILAKFDTFYSLSGLYVIHWYISMKYAEHLEVLVKLFEEILQWLET